LFFEFRFPICARTTNAGQDGRRGSLTLFFFLFLSLSLPPPLFFLSKKTPPPQYTKALASYDAAIKVAPSNSAEAISDLRVARAGCFMLLPSKLKEARSECDAALEASPGNLAALARRARANEGLGMFKAALGDVQKALRGVASGTAPGAAELREQEARLKDVVSGKRPGMMAMANGSASPSSNAPTVPRGLEGGGLPAAANGGASAEQELQRRRAQQQALLQQARDAQAEQQRAARRLFETHVTARITLPVVKDGGGPAQESSQLVSLNGKKEKSFCFSFFLFFEVVREKKKEKSSLSLSLSLPLLPPLSPSSPPCPPPPTADASLADLLDGIRFKFAKELGIPQEELELSSSSADSSSKKKQQQRPLKIVWRDPPDGEAATLRDASDVARAAASYRVRSGASGVDLKDPSPLQFEVSFDDDAPVPPEAELDAARASRLSMAEKQRKLRAMLAEAEREAAAEEEKRKRKELVGGGGGEDGGGEDSGEGGESQLQYSEAAVEGWVLDFAALFRDKLGVDADRALDLQAVGWEALQSALEETTADDAAVPLFDKACDRFSESAATAMLQWGNVFTHLAHRALVKGFYTCDAAKGSDERAKKSARDAAAREADNHFKAAASKYQEAERIRGNYHDTHASVANLELERAKLAAGLVAPPAPKPDGEEKVDEKAIAGLSTDEAVALTQAKEKAAAEANQAALHAAMRSSLTQNSVRNAEGNLRRAWQSFEKAEAAVPADERNRKQPLQPADGSPITEEPGPWANIMVMWGNALYEASQLFACVNLGNEKQWRPLLDSAVSKFRDAGCPEVDIQAALRAHLAAEKLDLEPVDDEKMKVDVEKKE